MKNRDTFWKNYDTILGTRNPVYKSQTHFWSKGFDFFWRLKTHLEPRIADFVVACHPI